MQGHEEVYNRVGEFLCNAYGNGGPESVIAHATIITACAHKEDDKLVEWLDQVIDCANRLKQALKDGKESEDQRVEA